MAPTAPGELNAQLDTLAPELYAELRQMAALQMARETPGQTLQATALVHEAWLRLSKGASPWKSRAHFFGAAAEAMRRILVDAARRKHQIKRGSNAERMELEESQIAGPSDDDRLLRVHEVLDLLASEDPLKADIVKMRYFVGLNHDEIAQSLGLNERTVRRHWELAKVRLMNLMEAT